jgi:hypothetical protein
MLFTIAITAQNMALLQESCTSNGMQAVHTRSRNQLPPETPFRSPTQTGRAQLQQQLLLVLVVEVMVVAKHRKAVLRRPVTGRDLVAIHTGDHPVPNSTITIIMIRSHHEGGGHHLDIAHIETRRIIQKTET